VEAAFQPCLPHLRPILETGCLLPSQGGLPEACGDTLAAPILGKQTLPGKLPGPAIDTIAPGERSLACWGPCRPRQSHPYTGARVHRDQEPLQGYVRAATLSRREREGCGQTAAAGPQAKEQTLALAHSNSNKHSN